MKRILFTYTVLIAAYLLTSCSAVKHRQVDAQPFIPINTLSEFNRQLTLALNHKDTQFFEQYVHKQILWGKIQEKNDACPMIRKTIQHVMQEKSGHMWASFFRYQKDNALWSLSQSRRTGSVFETLIRLDAEGIDYFRFYIHQTDTGLKIYDFYIFSKATLMSDSFAYLFDSLCHEPQTPENIQTNRLITSIKKDFEAKRFAYVYGNIQRLPENLQHSVDYMHYKLYSAYHLGSDAYQKTLAECNSLLTETPEKGFFLIDTFLELNELDKAIAVANAMARYIGKDAGIKNLLACIHYMKKEYHDSVIWAYEAIKLEPYYEAGYWTLLQSLLTLENYALTLATIDVLEQRFGYTFDQEALLQNPVYENLLASSAYKKWMQERAELPTEY